MKNTKGSKELKKGTKVTITKKYYNRIKRAYKNGRAGIEDLETYAKRYQNKTKATIVEPNAWNGGYWIKWSGDINEDHVETGDYAIAK